MSPKVLMLGLDGADYNFINENRAELPILDGLISSGSFGKLRTLIPPTTGACWPAAMSGKNPARTGITGFVKGDSGKRGKLISSKSIATDLIWDILSRQGKKVGVINVPVTYPPKRINGFMITGLLTPSEKSNFTYPPELKDELKDYRLSVDWQKYSSGDADGFLKDLYDCTRKRAETTIRLMKEREWDFLMTVFSGTDWVQHFFHRPKEHPEASQNMRIILDYFKYVDTLVGDILQNCDEDTYIFIISDHGFGRCPHKYVHFNRWLLDKGLLHVYNKGRAKEAVRDRVFSLAQVPGAYRLITKVISKKTGGRLYGKLSLGTSDIDSNLTEAHFSEMISIIGYISILNSDNDERELLKDSIVKELKDMRDPDTGEHIIEEVYKKEELYSGPFLEELGDVVFLFNKGYRGENSMSDRLITDIPLHLRFSSHDMDGILIAHGPDIKRREVINARLTDVTPTILRVMDSTISEDMDGRVLEEIFQ